MPSGAVAANLTVPYVLTSSASNLPRSLVYSYTIVQVWSSYLYVLVHDTIFTSTQQHCSCSTRSCVMCSSARAAWGDMVLVSGTIFSVDDRRRCEGRCVRTRIYTRIVFIAGCGFNLMQHEVCGDAPTSRRLPERARGVRDTYY